MTRWSLRARMLALSALATVTALVIAAWSIAGILSRFVTEGLDRRLDAQIAMMASAVRSDGSVDRALVERRIGIMPSGPDWRWRIDGPDGAIGSADFPTLDAPPPPPAPLPPGPAPTPPPVPQPPPAVAPLPKAPQPRTGSDSGGTVHAREASITTSRGVVTLTAAAPSQVVARPIRAALVPLLSVIATLAVLFTLAALFQLRLALKPITALREQLAQIREGTRTAVDEDQPAELRPLALELNALSGESAAALQAARASAANLAHALKTPVATLALTLENDPRAAGQITRIEGVIRHHLAKARTIAVAHRARTPLGSAVADVVGVIRTLHPALTIDVAVPDALDVALDAHDLSEILGNLLDNAARHARSRIAVSAKAEDGRVAVTIEDDGPGIAASQRDLALQPGIRLDETPQGDGFGLAIVRDLVALHGGTLALAEGRWGGLLVALSLLRAG